MSIIIKVYFNLIIMEKDFDRWNELKKEIENNTNDLIIKEWEIWWSSVWVNIGAESCWKWLEFRRPVLVVKKLSKDTCFVIPLSTKIKTGTWFVNYTISWKKYTALLYQLKMMHTNRFTKREFKLKQVVFKEIKKRLKSLLNL